MTKQDKLNKIDKMIKEGLTSASVLEILKIIGVSGMDEQSLKELKLYCEYVPMFDEDPYTEEQRYLHFLWETIDKVALGIDSEFAI